jgi:low affinity Fe/Cu permease
VVLQIAFKFSRQSILLDGYEMVIRWNLAGHRGLGSPRTIFPLLRHMQLVANTATTIVTFLMIQNTQNRDARAIHLKLDEVIRAMQQARNEMIDIEKLSDEELEGMSKTFEAIRLECAPRKGGTN